MIPLSSPQFTFYPIKDFVSCGFSFIVSDPSKVSLSQGWYLTHHTVLGLHTDNLQSQAWAGLDSASYTLVPAFRQCFVMIEARVSLSDQEMSPGGAEVAMSKDGVWRRDKSCTGEGGGNKTRVMADWSC